MDYDLAQLVRQAGTYRRDEFTPRTIDPLRTHENQLLRIYMRVVRGWQSAWYNAIRPVYERTLSELITDTVDDAERAAARSEAEINRLVVLLAADLEGWHVIVEQWHRSRFVASFTPTGVNLSTLLTGRDVAETLEAALRENTSLIRSLNDQMRNGISGSVFRGLQARSPAREVAREIRKVANIGRRRAELIASDQLQKLTGRLDEERQRQAGFDSFKWRHSGKVNFRPEHKARDGKTFNWRSRIARTDPPGRAIRCGCRAQAVLKLT